EVLKVTRKEGMKIGADLNVCIVDDPSINKSQFLESKFQVNGAVLEPPNPVQVTIHEAMQQQAVSICKAGIQAMMNAQAFLLPAEIL
ncbi:hypothetical protein Pmar_PMAR000257, partial [Perkinsus marinus ATCC 50983]